MSDFPITLTRRLPGSAHLIPSLDTKLVCLCPEMPCLAVANIFELVIMCLGCSIERNAFRAVHLLVLWLVIIKRSPISRADRIVSILNLGPGSGESVMGLSKTWDESVSGSRQA